MADTSLPIFKSDEKDLVIMQNRWASIINPFLKRPQNQSIILKNISLVTGSNTIRHGLNSVLQGWKLTRQKSAASIYDNQDSNPTPEATLILVSSADVVCDIEVF